MKFRLNLAVSPGDDRVELGYEQIVTAADSREAIADYVYWLLCEGLKEEDMKGRVLCDPDAE